MFYKRIISLILTAVLLVGMVPPLQVGAEEMEETVAETLSEVTSEPAEEATEAVEESGAAETTEVAVSAPAAEAAVLRSGTCGADLTWELDDEGVLTISGTGAMDDYDSMAPWDTYRRNYDRIVVEEGVTSIGMYAFSGLSVIESIILPESLTSIGYAAFQRTLMNSIEIPDAVTTIGPWAFESCTDLESLTLPETLTSIGGWAFQNCDALTEVTLPGSLTEVGEWAFFNCDALETVVISEGVAKLGKCAFYGCNVLTDIQFPDTYVDLGYDVFSGCIALEKLYIPASQTGFLGAFNGCKSLYRIEIDPAHPEYTSVDGVVFSKDMKQLVFYPASKADMTYTVPDGVEDISSGAFTGCVYLHNLILPDSITVLGESALSGTESLSTVQLPSTLTTIGESAFADCTQLSSITIPEGVQEIGWSAFYGCKALATVQLPSTLTTLEGNTFADCTQLSSITVPGGVAYVGGYTFEDCTQLHTVILQEGVQEIGQGAFAGCTKLKNVTVPSSMQRFDFGVFENCTALEEITLPDTMSVIMPFCFRNCTSLTRMVYPRGVDGIGYEAFAGCTSLKEIVLHDGIIEIFERAFMDCTSLTEITIPTYCYTIDRMDGIFRGCTSLENIYVSPESYFYRSVDGVLYDVYWEDEDFNCENAILGGVRVYPAGRKDTSFTVPNGVEYIGRGAFACSNLETITLPSSVVSIGARAFEQSKLRTIVIPDEVHAIGSSAFSGCSQLVSITLPTNLTGSEDEAIGIYKNAFKDCTALQDVYYKGTEEQWAQIYIDYGNDCLTNANIHYRGIIDSGSCGDNLRWELYEGVMTISGSGAMPDYERPELVPWAVVRSKIKSLVIGQKVTSVGQYAFAFCDNLTEVVLKDDVAYIAEFAFEGCKALERIQIPGRMKNICNCAFWNCGSLKEVVFAGTRKEYEKLSVVEAGNESLLDSAWTVTGFCEFLDNSDITINGSGSAYVYFEGQPYQTITYESPAGTETYTASGKGIYRLPLGTFDTEGETDVTVRIIKVNDTVLNPAVELSTTVTVTPMTFTQNWQVSLEREIGKKLNSMDKEIGPYEVEVDLGSLGASAGLGSSLTITKEHSGEKESLEISSDRSISLGASINLGVKVKEKGAKTANISAKLGAGISKAWNDTYGIRFANFSINNEAQRKAVAAYLLGEFKAVEPNEIMLDRYYLGLEKNIYKDSKCVIIQGSSNSIGGKITGEIGPVKINGKSLFGSGFGGTSKVAVTNAEQVDTLGFEERSASYKSSRNVQTLLAPAEWQKIVNLGGALNKEILGKDIKITAKKDWYHGNAVVASYLSASKDGIGTFTLNKRYSDVYDKFTFRGDALRELLQRSSYCKALMNDTLPAMSVMDISAVGGMLSFGNTPVDYSRLVKSKTLKTTPLSLGDLLNLPFDFDITLSSLEDLSYTSATGQSYKDDIYITGESTTEMDDVLNEKETVDELMNILLVSLREDISEYFTVEEGYSQNGLGGMWAWWQSGGKRWTVSLFYDGNTGSNAWNMSAAVDVQSARSLAMLEAGISNTQTENTGNYTLTKAATIGRPFAVTVWDPETGEEVTDLGNDPLIFTIRYAAEDLEAAGLNVYSPAYLDGEIAMYRYSDDGDFFEYIGGVNDLEAMTVTADITKPGQYVLAVDACAPSLKSLDVSDFRQNPTITAYVDDLTGLDGESFEFCLDGQKKVWSENLTDHYDPETGKFTYTVPAGEELVEGEHSMAFVLADTTGNGETYEYTFSVDLTAPELGIPTVTGSVNDGSVLEIRVQVSDANLTDVYAVFSKLLPDGTWSDEVSTPMGDMGNGLWGLDYEGDGSTVKIRVVAEDIGENTAESEAFEVKPYAESVSISEKYLMLDVDQQIRLTAEVQPVELASNVVWTVEAGGENVISIDNGTVTALGEGTAYVIASVTDGNVTLTDRCRIDVAAPIELNGIQLSTNKLTTELYSTDYAEFDVLLKLSQNYAATAAATVAMPENKGVAITSAKFTDPELADLFDLVTLDDRTVAVVPNEKAVWNPDLVGKSYSSAVTVTVQGKEYTSEALTLTVKKTLPKLKATVPAFNNFWSGQTQEITITGATVTGISCENLPDWLELNGTELSLTENVPAKGGSAKLTLLMETEEWAVPVETALAVKCSYKAPGLKLSASSIQLAGANSDGVQLQLLSNDKKLTLGDLGVSGISTPEGYSISNYNVEDGSFVIKAAYGFQPGKINLEVGFHNTSETVAIPLTVKVVPVTLKLAPSSVTLNSGTGDSAAVNVTATPADYRLTAPNIRILDAAKQDKTDSGELKLSYENGRLSISTTDLTPDNAKYTLYISAEGGKEVALKISTTNAEPTLKLKANGNLDLSFPDRKIGLTTTFKNHSGGNLQAIDYTVTESSGKTILDEDSKAIRLIKDGADLFVQLKETAGINIKNTYTLNLKLTLENGKELESSVKIPVKQTNISLKLSANKLTLNKAIDDKASVTVTCATKDYNFTEPALTLLDSKGNDASGQLDISWDNGKLTVATTEATPYGGSYKLQIAPEKGAKAVALAIVIPAEAKSKVTGTLKATGNLDVIRDGTALTVTPTWKNCNDAEREEILTIRNGNGEDVTAQFVITEENGKYILTRAGALDHTQKYTATLTATFTNGTTATATGALKLKMGSAKLTLRADSTTLFANDKHSRVNISFASADSTLNKVAKVTLDPKLANQFELFDYGNGQYAIGFKDGIVPAKLTSANISLNIWLEGNETAKANASVKVKVSIIR